MSPYRVLPFCPVRGYTSTLMTSNRASRVTPSAFWAPVICLLVAAQLLLAFSLLMEWQFGADARSHVEAAGTSIHHAHNPTDCAACSARGLLVSTGHAAPPAFEARRSLPPRLAERDEHLALLIESQSRPRAPPFRLA